MNDFNDKAERAGNNLSGLTGYMGFAFGEGQKDNPSRYAGRLIDRPLQKAFVEWKPDCVVYTAQFDTSKKLPSEEVQKEAILAFFKNQGAAVLKIGVKVETDTEEMSHPIRAVLVQVPLEETDKARKAILDIDAACNGFHTRRLKAKGLQP